MTMLTRRTWAIFAAIFALCLTRAEAQTASEELRRADRQFGLYAYNLALKSYQSVIEKDPENAQALARLADCYVQLNRPDEALQWYDRALAHNDAKPVVMLHYGQALMAVGNYAGAKKWFVFYANHSQAEGQHFSEMCDYALKNAEKEALYAASNESSNTAAADFLPTFLGDRLVFSSARADLARSKKGAESVDWAGSAYNQLFVTQRDAKGNLQKPAFLKSDLANTYNEGPVSFSADGKRVAFCRNNFVDGSRQIAESGVSMSLYIAEIVDGQWVNVKAFPYNGSDYATGFPSLSADGNTLFFASNQPEGEGGWDIYSSHWTGKYWTQPTNLGKTVNSKGNEITPFFDGKNLYFASDWHFGFGGMDVFRAEKEDTRWAKIFHLGPSINSSRDDYGLVFNAAENIGYFTSNRPQGKGNEDIWRVRKKTDDFVITVLDAAMMPIAGAEVDFSACKGSTFTTDADGKCAFSAPTGQLNCAATIRKTGYREANVEVKSVAGARQFSVALTSIKPASEPAAAARRDEPLASSDKAPMIFSDVKPQAYNAPSRSASPSKVLAEEAKPAPKTLEQEAETLESRPKARGFSVQIAALQGDATPAKLAKYDNVKSFGNLYVQQNDFEAKVRLGVFETREAAAIALQKVEALGYRKPFVVEEKSADGGLMIYQNPPKTAKLAAKSPEPVAYSTPKSSAVPVETEARFAVQVASLSNDEPYSLDPFAKLSDVGKVYSMPVGGAVKIRVGVWRERAEAEAARKQIVRRGFADAMLVEEKASPAVDRYLQENEEPAAAAPVQYSTKSVQPSAPKTQPNSPYKVRVATYEEAYNFNLDKLEGIEGKLETRKNGKNTIFLLAGYPNLEAALRAKNAVRERGFRDAHVVKEEDGDLVKLKL